MNFKKLKEEVENDPLSRGYVSMDDGQIADSLNALNRQTINSTRLTYVAMIETLGIQDAVSILEKLEALVASNTTVKWALKTFNSNGLDLSKPKTISLIDKLVTASILTSAEATQLKQIAEQTVSRATELGLKNISSQMVIVSKTGGY